MSKIINWPDGIIFKDAGNISHWWWPWVKPVFAWETQDPSVIYCDSNNIFHKPYQPKGVTDFGSIPGALQVVPSMNPLRFKIPCMFHDDVYQTHKFLISKDNGITWEIVPVTERQANDRLHDMIKINPNSPGNEAEANAYWLGVQAGGWTHWKNRANSILRLRRTLSINPNFVV